MDTNDADYCTIGSLNDLLFCPRRCALHRIEGLWAENVATIEGSLAHKRVHADPADEETSAGGRVVRGLWLRSDRLRLVGIADLVEFRPEPYPVEYKRGKRRRWDNDDVQLCAQALCLEEMLGRPVPRGAVFHVRSKRRRELEFDVHLRQMTEEAAARLHQLIQAGEVPPPILHPKCQQCSLHAVCMPELISAPARYRSAAEALFVVPSPDHPAGKGSKQ
jgi:CRISPR-associated exonuclease Cas4